MRSRHLISNINFAADLWLGTYRPRTYNPMKTHYDYDDDDDDDWNDDDDDDCNDNYSMIWYDNL